MSKKKVAFLELTVFSNVTPLASGYMEAYARKDPLLRDSFEFEKHSLTAKTPIETVLATLEKSDADVYAFSCYVWNSGMVKRLLPKLLASRPSAYYMLGGPQVINQGERYLSSQHENVIVCNGEGERTFSGFLKTLLDPVPDFSKVRGLSFYKNGALITTEAEPRITDLSEIPSPFLEGLFEKDKYVWTVIETNRGCPFKCNYCFWGAAIGAKVYKYGEDRVEKELAWISESRFLYVFFADANWGMLKRDVELSRYLADCKKKHGTPITVYFAGAKNSPSRVAEITEIFSDAGMVTTQSIALQTMSAETLKKVNRDNIKSSTYTELQKTLNDKKISSFIEMIWPLPGETLASFQSGLSDLCKLEADSFLIYPLLLMNNVELAQQRDEYGLVTAADPDPNSEAEMVVQTKEVDGKGYLEGIRFMYAVTALYSLRGLWSLGRYLSSIDKLSYAELLRGFIDFCKRQPNHPYMQFCEGSIERFEHHRFDNIGGLVHLTLHSERSAFDDLLRAFATAQPFWQDEAARFFFEVDLIHRPYIYRSTPIVAEKHRFELLSVVDILPHGYRVQVPERFRPALEKFIALPGVQEDSTGLFEVNHRRQQLPFMRHKSMEDNYSYCQDMLHKMRSILPLWSEVGVRPGHGNPEPSKLPPSLTRTSLPVIRTAPSLVAMAAG